MKWIDTIHSRIDALRARHSEGRVGEWARKIRPYLPPVNFITVHYAYFILSCLFFALVFWGTGSSASVEIGFLDSLYLSMSALTSTGLNTVNVSQMSTGQQVVLFLAMLLGHPVLISLWTVLFRRHVFEKRFRAIVRAERERKLRAAGSKSSLGLSSGIADLLALARLRSRSKAKSDDELPGVGTRIHEPPQQPQLLARATAPPQILTDDRELEAGLAPIQEGRALPQTPGHRSIAFVEPPRSKTDNNNNNPNNDNNMGGIALRNFLEEKRKHVGRNGEFFNLTLKEREYLGGVEYRAIEVLVVTVAMYYVLWPLLGAVALGAWIAVRSPEIAAVNAQNPWWAGIFLAVSAFTNGGMTLLDAGMTAFQSGYYFVVLVTAVLILAGSQASPIFLRFIFWVLSKLLKFSTKDDNYAVWKETFDFILQYPRRVYINMFPARPTWMLTIWLGGFLVVDWAMFYLLNIGNSVIESIPPGPRVVDGLFQTVSLLSGGFTVVPISAVYFGLQVLWLVKMYASAYPTSITVRGSNVYEERSLGIYAGDEPEESAAAATASSTDNSNQEKKAAPLAAGGLFLSPNPASAMQQTMPQTPMSATSQASRLSSISMASRRGLDKIVGIGKESTAIIGRQLQRRMTGFQGVGVAPVHPRRPLKKVSLPTPRPGTTTAQSSTPDTGIVSSSSSSSTVSVVTVEQAPTGPQDLVSHHVRSQLSHDVWWIALAFFLITIIETSHTLADPAAYSLFNILFEIVSAYANNGVSVGLPTAAYSFSGGWRAGSKFVLILVMLRGRHRDLPVALDRAVKLPSIDLDEKEEDDAEIRRAISRTPNLGGMSPVMSPGLVRPFNPTSM
ncbi:cation transport protein-domain-containing protein [Chaetomium strumarium]|uniref:Cation transport protein-domain-containing protein n=1 Tax=Chaetomium strumarium TaxID=1170767 RepID=A0AAJ0LYX8_9PEZI|nr:cation transport protein-domain-containing protein [Chaetomium strumarium]